MTIQTDLSLAMKLFSSRLDDANETVETAGESGSPAATIAYLSRQTILLTDLCAALCTAVVELANQADEQKLNDSKH